MSCSKHELVDIFAQVGNTPSSSCTSSSSATLTAAEIQSIFKGRQNIDANWLVDKNKQKKGQDSKMPKQDARRKDLSVSERQYNIPPNQTFAIKRAFYFCLMKSCISRKRFRPSIPIPPQSVGIVSFETLTEEDTDIIHKCGFNIVYHFFFHVLSFFFHFYLLLG